MWFPIAIIATVFSFVLMIIRMSQLHEQEKLRLTKGSDKSLTVSELNEMIEERIKEIIAPLNKRIAELEEESLHIDPTELPEASRRLDLEEVDTFEEIDSQAASRSRKRVQ